MRLIDADALMKDIIRRFCCKPHIEVGNKGEYVHEIIDSQPTAYDVDKVIEQLTENINSVETELANLKGVDQQILLAEREHLIGKKLAYATAIDLIRKGGIE